MAQSIYEVTAGIGGYNMEKLAEPYPETAPGEKQGHKVTLEIIKHYFEVSQFTPSEKPIRSAHWAFFANRKQAKAFRAAARKLGFQIVLLDWKGADGKPFPNHEIAVVFTISGPLTVNDFYEQAMLAKSTVEAHGGCYDGYEHSARRRVIGNDIRNGLGPKEVIDYEPESYWKVKTA